MHWYFEVLGKYAVFEGRARRKEYWSFVLINLLIIFLLTVFEKAFLGPDAFVVTTIYLLIILLPATGVWVRRLHDAGHSGAWIIPCAIPIIGFFLALYFGLKDGFEGTNEYGENPKQDSIKSGINLNKPIDVTAVKVKTHKKNTTSSTLESKKSDTREMDENGLYEQIWKEIEEKKYDVGLWAKCFATCDGDENKTKALYVNKRVIALKEVLEKQLADKIRKAEEEMEKERTKKIFVLEGRCDNIDIFRETLKQKPDFFPKVLEQYGYNLVQNDDRPEMWSILSPNGIGAKHVYNLYDLRYEIKNFVEEQEA